MSTPLPPTRPPPMNLCFVLSESKRIILANRRHFLGLSVLVLLPLSFFSTIYLILQNHIPSSQLHRHSQPLLRHYSPTTTTTAAAASNANTSAVSIIFPLIYCVVSNFLTLLAVGSITFSAYHGFFGRPVKLISSILSLLRSFLPLLFTSLAALLIRYLIYFAFGLIMFFLIGVEFMIGFGIEKSSPIFMFSCLIAVVLLLTVTVYLGVNWALASVIVVVESSWGFEPLRRSTKLIKGTRRLQLSLMLLNGICSGFLLLGCSFFSNEFDGDIRSWKTWSFVLRMVVSTAGSMVLMLLDVIATTVVYMYCKAVHGEHAARKMIDEEVFAGEYVSLPFDDDVGKLYHVVSVMPTCEV